VLLSMSECPSHCCTVRRSTPAQRHFVANVARNLCSQKLSGSSRVRLTTAFRQSRKSSLGLHPAVGNTRAQPFDAFAFHSRKLLVSFAGIGISRSLYAFGVHPLSGLWLTRTVDAAKLTSVQYVNITSCSRSPVIKKNSYQSLSSAPQAAKTLSSSAASYISGSSSVKRGQSFLPTSPRTPCALRKDMRFSNLLYTLRGACSFSSRRKAQNLSKSLRSRSSMLSL